MSIDAQMARIVGVFFDECRDALEIMEAGLLRLDAAADAESLDSIFRAAHSIKGGAATFGFHQVAGFTHGAETLLDEMRAGKRAVEPETVRILLEVTDTLRAMLQAAESATAFDDAGVANLERQMAQQLNPAGTAAAHGRVGWHIRFEPVTGLLKVRNEPTRMFAELATLGRLESHADVSGLPAIESLDPENCHLAWDLKLFGTVDEQRIRDIFDWVDPACTLRLTALEPEAPARRDEGAALPEARPVVAGKAAESSSIRVATEKLDQVINLIGELIITQSMLGRYSETGTFGDFEELQQGLSQLARNTRELQQHIMQMRMLPISYAFNRLPRLVHDLSGKLGKKVMLQVEGEGTEIDKTVLEKITDPLTHLVRNALDHGIETPAQRIAAGKPEIGRLHLLAFHEGSNIIIELRDDGAGLNEAKILGVALQRGLIEADRELTLEQIHNLIFLPGFSTADAVTDVSGRGVGMDVVRRNINDLGGYVQITSQRGLGSTVRIRLPLTLAILDGQLVRVGGEIYVISLLAIVETIQVEQRRLKTIGERAELIQWRDEYLPVVKLCNLFDVEPDSNVTRDGLIVVVESDGRRVGLLVDDLLAQQQVVIKNIEENFKPVEGVAGATILGDGSIALILDIPGLISRAAAQRRRPSSSLNNSAMAAAAAS
jgi:two-component system chemotaxis sensor kinase CheA